MTTLQSFIERKIPAFVVVAVTLMALYGQAGAFQSHGSLRTVPSISKKVSSYRAIARQDVVKPSLETSLQASRGDCANSVSIILVLKTLTIIQTLIRRIH